MDTVTEARMAIAMAIQGGLGVIHKNMDPEDQAKMVARVKHYLNGRINTPITVKSGMTMTEVENMRQEKRYKFHTFPVISDKGKMLGILTGSDTRFAENGEVTVAQAMTALDNDFLYGDPGTTAEAALVAMRKAKKNIMPLLDRGKIIGMYVFSDLERIFSGGTMHNVDQNNQLIAAAAVGAGKDALIRAEQLAAKGCDVFHIDTAHGDSKNVLWTIKELKKNHEEIDVIAGNVSHHDAVTRLISAGAGGIMVGQGPGSICTTRTQAGIGCPQVTAVYRCAKEAEGTGVPVCADGGIQDPGDIAVAIAIGASSVMLGSLLAGTDASPGEVVTHHGREMKYYRGMGSLAAMLSRAESRARYGQAGVDLEKLVPEGIEGMVPYKGSLTGVLNELAGGLRAGMGYTGSADIKDFQEKAELLRITGAGLAESHPHDITQI